MAIVATAALLATGCKNPKPYQELASSHGGHLGYIAALADLVAAGSAKEAKRSSELAGELARSKIVARAKSAAPSPTGPSATTETVAVSKRLQMLTEDCESTKDKGADLRSCARGLEKLAQAVETAGTSASKQGLKADVLLALDPKHASDEGKQDAAPIRAALAPSKEEEKLAAVWSDPAATYHSLNAACRDLSAAHGYKSERAVAGSARGGDDDWLLPLMMARDPIMMGSSDPLKMISVHRIAVAAQQCVTFHVMETYAKNGDECAASATASACQLNCSLFAGSSSKSLFANAKEYGPKSQNARVATFLAACGQKKEM